MAAELRLPVLGDVMTEGTLTSWMQPDGAEVRAGQPLYQVETDKVSFTVEAPEAGVLRQLVPAGSVVAVGTLVGRIAEAAAGDGSTSGEVLATPAARRLARELGVELAAIGAGRRLREADVRAWHAAAGPASAPAGGDLPYGGRRRVIGERMLISQRKAAALTLTSEVRADAALEMIDGLNQEWRAAGVVLTLTRLVVKACAHALREHPVLNARLDGDRIVPSGSVDVALAVDHEAGLIVPVLRGVDRLSLKQVAGALHDLTRRAESGGLTREEAEGGTFTVTSLASTVVDAFTPIINPPQAAIMGLGRVREVAAFESGAVVRHRVTTLSLTFDHRLTDGGPAARFLGRVAELLQRPSVLMAPP